MQPINLKAMAAGSYSVLTAPWLLC